MSKFGSLYYVFRDREELQEPLDLSVCRERG